MRLYGDDLIVDETILVGQVTDGRPFRLDGLSGPARVRLLHVFHLRDGKIAREKVWFDSDDLRRQLQGPASKRAARAPRAAAKPRRAAGAPGASVAGKKSRRKRRER